MSHFKATPLKHHKQTSEHGRQLFARYANNPDRRFEYLERKLDGIHILLMKMYQREALRTVGELPMDALALYPRGTFTEEIDRLAALDN